MVARKRKRINWLKLVDAASLKLPRSRNWIYYPWFFFARYPQLRPAASPDRKKQFQLENSREAFQEELRNWEKRIAVNDTTRQVLEGLDSQQRAQLCALMVDCKADIEDYVERLPHHKTLKQWASAAPSCKNNSKRRNSVLTHRKNILRRKLAHVHEAVGNVVRELVSRDLPRQHILNSRIDIYRRAYGDLENYLRKFPAFLRPTFLLEDALPKPGSITLPNLKNLLKTPGFHVIPENPIAPCMIKLYWFFRHGCRISGNASEVRVVLLRNAFWQNEKIPLIDNYKERADKESSAGCDAVKRAVQRYSTGLPSK